MSVSRKARFILIMSAIGAGNAGIWFAHKFYGLSMKQMGGYFAFVGVFDFAAVLGFAALGVLTAYLLAFRPDALKKSIERSMAKISN